MQDYAARLNAILQDRPPPSGGNFQFGAINPAYQPLANDLNFWLSGGYSGPNAPGARGPMQTVAKKGRR